MFKKALEPNRSTVDTNLRHYWRLCEGNNADFICIRLSPSIYPSDATQRDGDQQLLHQRQQKTILLGTA